MSNVLTVAQAKAQADGMVIPGVSGILSEVKPIRTVATQRGTSTVQDFKLQDGNEYIYGAAWDFFDMSPSLGTQVVLVSNKAKNNRFGGVMVKDKANRDGSGIFKNLSVSNVATLHSAGTYAASTGAPAPVQQQTLPLPSAPLPQPTQRPPAVQQSYVPPAQNQPVPAVAPVPQINGQTVGMSVKGAIDILIATKAFAEGGYNYQDANMLIHRVASGIISVSQRLERGDLYVDSVDPIVESFVTRTRIMKPDPQSEAQDTDDINDDSAPF